MSFAKIAKLIANSLQKWKVLINFGKLNLTTLHGIYIIYFLRIPCITVKGDSYHLEGQIFIIIFGVLDPLFDREFKEIEMILGLFLVIAMYCQGSSSQIKSITQPLPLLASWEGSLGICSR